MLQPVSDAHHILVYDGTMAGLLTAIFDVYEQGLAQVSLVKEANYQPSFLATASPVLTDAVKASRVWSGLGKRTGREAQQQFFQTFLSELPGVEAMLLAYARHVFAHQNDVTSDYAYGPVLEVAQTARKVWREKHRMEAFVRFQLLQEALWYARIEPDYNVLPLIVRHFKSRYADMNWLIYDLKRGYGMHHVAATGQVTEVTLDFSEEKGAVPADALNESEAAYQDLWKAYFHHTGIPARKNPKLHLRHIPARYWRYLPEKH